MLAIADLQDVLKLHNICFQALHEDGGSISVVKINKPNTNQACQQVFRTFKKKKKREESVNSCGVSPQKESKTEIV